MALSGRPDGAGNWRRLGDYGGQCGCPPHAAPAAIVQHAQYTGGGKMIEPDDLQRLWQDEGARQEDPTMWRALIQEKRTGWNELVRAEDQAWYLIALCLVPLTAWAAWTAKYPWGHVGYGLMAATIVLSTVATWIAGRHQPHEHDHNLRQHLDALLESYDRRSRFVRGGGWWAMGGLTAGLAAVILGIPDNASNPRAWGIAVLLVAGANAAQWAYSRQSVARISRKRDEAARLLQNLLAGGQDFR